MPLKLHRKWARHLTVLLNGDKSIIGLSEPFWGLNEENVKGLLQRLAYGKYPNVTFLFNIKQIKPLM